MTVAPNSTTRRAPRRRKAASPALLPEYAAERWRFDFTTDRIMGEYLIPPPPHGAMATLRLGAQTLFGTALVVFGLAAAAYLVESVYDFGSTVLFHDGTPALARFSSLAPWRLPALITLGIALPGIWLSGRSSTLLSYCFDAREQQFSWTDHRCMGGERKVTVPFSRIERVLVETAAHNWALALRMAPGNGVPRLLVAGLSMDTKSATRHANWLARHLGAERLDRSALVERAQSNSPE